jgi:SAM-dependent methyltransferase/uncharacterized protein YbaR (Trm112 family)
MRCLQCGADALEPVDTKATDGELTGGAILCASCGLRYPIEKGVPRMLPASLLNIDKTELEKWKKTYRETESHAIDDDRKTYKSRHRLEAEAAHIPEEKASYLWENMLFKEAYEAFQEVPETHGLAWTRTQEAGARRNALIFEIIQKWEPDLAGKRVLHTGSGYDNDIGGRFKDAGANLINSDIIIQPLQGIHEQFGHEGICSDLRNMPFKDNVFDMVVCIEVIHHCHPLVPTLEEIRRILKPGGAVIVVENTLSHPGTWPGRLLPRTLIRKIRRRLRKSFGREERYLKVSPYELVVPPREVRSVMQKAGYKDLASEVSQYAIPVFPSRVVNGWERWGRRFPKIFRPFAFELTYLGRG